MFRVRGGQRQRRADDQWGDRTPCPHTFACPIGSPRGAATVSTKTVASEPTMVTLGPTSAPISAARTSGAGSVRLLQD